MLSCPPCGKKVPTKSIFQATGLSGVVCPHCNASLWPKYWSSALLMLLSFGLAWAVRALLSRAGVGFPVDLVAWLVAFVVFYVLLSPAILRLRVKESSSASLKIRGIL